MIIKQFIQDTDMKFFILRESFDASFVASFLQMPQRALVIDRHEFFPLKVSGDASASADHPDGMMKLKMRKKSDRKKKLTNEEIMNILSGSQLCFAIIR